ncbi:MULTISPECIES: hypothetical protein [Nostoc]|uniref:Restriction endonuclease domain-containing protein n=1 Tax=Nostoc paludosum FACHB-159 TaxID=2692908 RepID=A0ABR8KCH2_9NOSO|nr:MULTISPECIES: hypothetical protein [Nostoc]MBD2680237.1 hypothetical protein [Nostoc sp. FACHB-857]MBD2735863.1 hypothetical protein [Nostoc paludosum FACHB-159]
MTTTKQIVTFEQYLTYNDGTDTRYEMERGELIPVAQARGGHGEIMHFLERGFTTQIERLGLNWVARQAAIVLEPKAATIEPKEQNTILLASQFIY